MNFFQHQDEARQNTSRLMVLFGLAIALIILAFYLVTILTLKTGAGLESWWQPDIFLLIAVATLAIIGFGSLSKLRDLRRGGVAVAESLGGRLLTPQTNDPGELQLLNVVAEMALASSTPLPAVYLLDKERSINAFAAGHSTEDAIIGVTRGCLDQLTRDELQGVIGHEFSHILNGDMRLNLQLIGVLQGLLSIYILGRIILDTGWHVPIRVSTKDGKTEFDPFLIAGLAMVGIGGIGLLCGRLIKSAVSRQREFLADASAVQFTRNPDGIADALRKIGGYSSGSRLNAPRAEEASHLFFGEALPGVAFWGSWFATHPPVKERLRRLGDVTVSEAVSNPAALSPITSETSPVMGFQGSVPASTASTAASAPASTVAAVAADPLSPQNRASSQALLKQLPSEMAEAIQHSEGAIALIYALLLDTRPEVRSHQLQLLQNPDPQLAQGVLQLEPPLKQIDPRQHLALVDLAVPVLRTLTPPQLSVFFNQIKALVRADKQLSISEYVLQLILQKRLRPHPAPPASEAEQVDSIDIIWPDCLILLSVLARLGHQTAQDATYAFKSGLYRLPGAKQRELPAELPAAKLADLGTSLNRIGLAAPKLKQAVVEACSHTVLVDNEVTPREADLLRAIVITLDCPIPPFLEAIRYN